MEEFPLTFNRQKCYEIMKTNQTILIKEVRKELHDTFMKSVDDCTQIITFEFPDKLWIEHRIKIIGELLDRFGKLKIKMIGIHEVTRSITSDSEISGNIKKVIIDLMGDN